MLISGPDDLSKLPMCVNWHYKLNKHGKGVQLSFPIRITPRLYNKRVFVLIHILCRMAQCPHGQTLKYDRDLQSGSIKWINPGYSIVLLHGYI